MATSDAVKEHIVEQALGAFEAVDALRYGTHVAVRVAIAAAIEHSAMQIKEWEPDPAFEMHELAAKIREPLRQVGALRGT